MQKTFQKLQDTFRVTRDSMLLPKDTLEALLDSENINIKNFDLKLNKYIITERTNANTYDFKVYKYDRRTKVVTHWIAPDYARDDFNCNINTKKEGIFLQLLNRKNTQRFNIQLECNVHNKVVSHKGRSSVYENNILLDRWYGIPYFNARSVKGIVRSHIIADNFGGNENLALANPIFRYVFGAAVNDKRRGAVRFGEGWPSSPPIVEPYITNNHFPKYYGNESKPPADWQVPNPTTFLVIRSRDNNISTFNFFANCPEKSLNEITEIYSEKLKDEADEAFSIRKSKFIADLMPQDYRDGLCNTTPLNIWLQAWIRKTFEERGIGARRNVDYGKMNISN